MSAFPEKGTVELLNGVCGTNVRICAQLKALIKNLTQYTTQPSAFPGARFWRHIRGMTA